MDEELDRFWTALTTPPDEARPRVWWHWMDGNVDPEGIRLDLEWLHRVGVRGVQAFDGAMGTPLVVPQAVPFDSPEWHTARQLAIETANRLGLEFTVTTSAGWSAAGGPWVPAADAMKKIVWSDTVVTSPDARLAPLPDVAGPFQELPRTTGDETPQYSTDWVVLAVPAIAADDPLSPATIAGSVPITDPERLTDGSHADAAALPRDPAGPSSAWIEYRFAHPVSVAAATIGLPGPAGFGAAPAPTATLLASTDGSSWTVVAEFTVTNVPVRTASFTPTTATAFRLLLHGEAAEQALPRLADGVRVPSVLRRADRFLVSEFALYSNARVHAAEVKAGFGTAPDYYALDSTINATTPIDPRHVVDLTDHLRADGTLDWAPPPGRWRVLRLGASLTGATNGPAPSEATGLEVDKLDRAPVQRYLDHYLPKVLPTEGMHGLLSDSIESGPQNWTPRLREQFHRLRGYDPLPWLPTVTGLIVQDAAASDRFLFDLRRTIADLIAEEYYGTVRDAAHQLGLTYYAEALEDHRPQLGDDLTMRAAADVPMGAMWLFDAGTQTPNPTYLADLKGASSIAHAYGKSWTGAESMSAFHRPWSYAPQHLKHIADLELTLGVTRFCIHTSPHQPTNTPPPGIGLAPFLGQAFIRSEPWAELARPWIDYLARCSAVLNTGLPAVDLAVFTGEEAPLTALYGDTTDPTIPPEIGFDYVGLHALETIAEVENGRLRLAGANYTALVLGGSSQRMTSRALRRITALVDAGATLIGRRPKRSPSLADDPAEHQTLITSLWDTPHDQGRVIETDDVTAALALIGFAPPRTVSGRLIRWIGRRSDAHEITFVANTDTEPQEATVRSTTALSSWDPVTLHRTALTPDEHQQDHYRIRLAPLQALLLVNDGASPTISTAEQLVEASPDWTLELPGYDPIPHTGPRPWTALSAEDFAGIGTYTGTVEITSVPAGRAKLTIGGVGDLATVQINDVDCGTIWTTPYEIDITGTLHPGKNTIRIRAANTWMNRLISEARNPTGQLFAPVADLYTPDAVPRSSGLRGPVEIRLELHG